MSRPYLRASLVVLTSLAACAGPRPSDRTSNVASPDMSIVLDEWRALRPRPADELSTELARRQPRLIDAARAVRNVQGLPYPEDDVPRVMEMSIPGHDDQRPARLFGPKMTRDTPVVLMFPGGGWIAPSLDASSDAARALAVRTESIVLLVEPRGAPVGRPVRAEDRRFPGAHEDALAAYRWLLDHARELGGDPSRIALAGEGAGGGLALATAITARDRGLGGPAHLLLLTPVVGLTSDDPRLDGLRPLTRAALQIDQAQYAPTGTPQDARIDPATRSDLRGLPPTTLVLAQIDPARPGAERLAARMTEAGVAAETRLFEGTTAGFFGIGALVGEARQAQAYAASRLGAAFARPVATTPVRVGRR